jgi:excisionase family DNA binding protein
MNRKRRIEVTVENSLMIVRRSAHAPVWCAECPTRIQMITPDEAAALTGVSTRTIYRWVETHQLHFVETEAGRLLVCPDSLSR